MDSMPLEVTVLMPCLNEAETLAVCIAKALRAFAEHGISGEVLVADNGSTDGSQAIAEAAGARVVPIPVRGYGSALRGGIAVARGTYIIMGDADDSYDFCAILPFVERLRAGDDLVMGCRLPAGGGTVLPGAMPPLHRWLGNPVLSFLGRLFFGCPVRDFHCGLRGFRKSAIEQLHLRTAGMEFASEMVIKATLHKLRIGQVPVTLHPDGRSRPPHLRTWRDGWRHLRFMLLFSPKWLFLYPGLCLVLLGAVALPLLAVGPQRIGHVNFDTNSLLVAGMALIIGAQIVTLAIIARLYASVNGLLPEQPSLHRWSDRLSLESGLIGGLALTLAGLGLLLWATWQWRTVHFGNLDTAASLRQTVPAVTLMVLGIQLMFNSFFASLIGLRYT